jgi:hypothetical protein
MYTELVGFVFNIMSIYTVSVHGIGGVVFNIMSIDTVSVHGIAGVRV